MHPTEIGQFEEKGVNLMTGSKKENISLIATKCGRLVKYLEAKNNILLLTTSTRYDVSLRTKIAVLQWE